MGNDGGSIAGRAELVRSKKKEVRVESEMVARVSYYYDLSSEHNIVH